MDLTRPITLTRTGVVNEPYELNDVALVGGALQGNATHAALVGPAVARQFTEPFAKTDGLDVGGVWLGSGQVIIDGTTFGATRGDLGERMDAMREALLPVSGTDGKSVLRWYDPDGGEYRLTVRPDGPGLTEERAAQGGPDASPSGIPWRVKLLAIDPSVAYTPPPACVIDEFDRTVSDGLGTGPLGPWLLDFGDATELSVDGSRFVAALDGTAYPGSGARVHCDDYTYGMGIAFTMSMKFRVSVVAGSSHNTTGNVQLEDYNNGAAASVLVHSDESPILSMSNGAQVTLPEAFVADTDYILVVGVHYVDGVQKAKCYKVGDADPGWQVTDTCQTNPWPDHVDPGVQPLLGLYWPEASVNTISVDYVKVCPGVDF